MAERRREPAGIVIGLLTFLGGVALIVFTFALARDLFSQSPESAVGIKPGTALDTNKMVSQALNVATKVVLLIVMSGIGSILASRGIKLYVHGTQGKDERKDAP
ncbi:MAG TPA: hypothetical protein VNI20_07205 [Fimbriimonadaceae bacterium]|nr:hypothetical protein [Fimbriimonadaceae bacterium]